MRWAIAWHWVLDIDVTFLLHGDIFLFIGFSKWCWNVTSSWRFPNHKKSIYIRVRSFKNTLQVRQNSDGVIRLVRSNQIGDTGYGLWSTEFNRLTGSPDDPRCFHFAPGDKGPGNVPKKGLQALCTAKEHPEGTKCLSWFSVFSTLLVAGLGLSMI